MGYMLTQNISTVIVKLNGLLILYFIFQALDLGPLVVELLTLFIHSLQQIRDALFLGLDYLLIDNSNIVASFHPPYGQFTIHIC